MDRTHLDNTFGTDGAVMGTGRFGEKALGAGTSGEVRTGRSEAGIAEGSVEIIEQHVQVDVDPKEEIKAGGDSLHVHKIAESHLLEKRA